MKEISLLAIDGCLASTISNLIEAFSIANMWHSHFSGQRQDLFRTKIITPDGCAVTCSDCIQFIPHASFRDTHNSDYLIIPAFMPVPDATELRDPSILDYIHSHYAVGTTVASVCTGAFLLAETGLLNKKDATTNWIFEKKFRYRHPDVNLLIGQMITEQDNLICTGAVTAIMHLALKIIKREGSRQLASMCAKTMLVDPNSDSQAPYTIYSPAKEHKDTEIMKAEEYMRERFADIDSVDQVADFINISSRHFKRRFKKATGESPLSYLQKLRVQKTKDLLEKTLMSIEEITRLVGYEDSGTFRRLFKRYTNLSPREYRERFLSLETD